MTGVSAGTASGTKLIDNDRVTVWEWRFAKTGDNTGWHKHNHDYVVVPMADGRLKISSKDGETFADLTSGVPYFRKAGVEHDVINASQAGFSFLEIEVK